MSKKSDLAPKRIGIDARLWNETGVGRYIRNLVVELQEIDKENEYVLFALPKDIKNIQFQISLPRRQAGNFKFQIKPADIPWHSVREQWEFPKILKKEKLDLVHFPYFSIPIQYKGKYVLTVHDLILHHFPTGKASTRPSLIYWMKQLGYRYIISQAAKRAEKIITVSYATEQEIIDHLRIPKEKIVVTYEGIDTKISNLKSQISNLPGRYFLYVGNAYPHKNLEMLVEAFGLLVNKRPHARPLLKGEENREELKLILVGKEDYFYKRLEEKVIEMGLQDSIVFRHDIRDSELSVLYTRALALVQPSEMEGFGLPILEAMAKGCLVVASDIPVFREIAGNVPFYFSPINIIELKNVLESIAIGRIIDAEERKEKGKDIAKKFSWGKMAQQTLAVYQSCFGV